MLSAAVVIGTLRIKAYMYVAKYYIHDAMMLHIRVGIQIIFLISPQKRMLYVLIRSTSLRLVNRFSCRNKKKFNTVEK